ncbi:MAG: FHA domain-containing protein [Ferruginibacter sp.]
MFNLFKETTADVKKIRSALLQFIKEKLQRAEGGEGGGINGIYLFINCNDSDRYLYESVVFANNPGKFKDELQRIADDYAILLPSSWKLEITFTDKYPDHSYVAAEINTALFISTRKAGIANKKLRAYIRILNGHAEKDIYVIDPSNEKVNIGREVKAQLGSGGVRKNGIAFTSIGPTEINRSVSRQHAHIEWEAASGSFLIFADEGGIPPYNKMKVRTTEGVFIKIQATEVGHRLQEGDQVILGDTAVLEFTYTGTDD